MRGLKNVDHNYYMVNAREKYQLLRRICDINPNIYGIIFVEQEEKRLK